MPAVHTAGGVSNQTFVITEIPEGKPFENQKTNSSGIAQPRCQHGPWYIPCLAGSTDGQTRAAVNIPVPRWMAGVHNKYPRPSFINERVWPACRSYSSPRSAMPRIALSVMSTAILLPLRCSSIKSFSCWLPASMPGCRHSKTYVMFRSFGSSEVPSETTFWIRAPDGWWKSTCEGQTVSGHGNCGT